MHLSFTLISDLDINKMPGPPVLPRKKRKNGEGKERTGRISFKEAWLEEADVNGDLPRLYVQKVSTYSFKCLWCQSKELSVDNIGKAAVVQHAKTKKHREVASIRTGRNLDQVVFNVVEDENETGANNNEEDKEGGKVEEEMTAGETRDGRRGIQDYFSKTKEPPVAVVSCLAPKLNLENMAVRAEIRIALKAVEADWSYNSLDDISEFLMDIAPDSKILQKIHMKSSKLSYVVSHGLGPYFHNILVKDMKLAPSFTLGLDSATTKQLGLSKSLDFKVRYFSERFGMVSFRDFI